MGDDDSDFSEERVWTITSRWFYFFPSYFLFPVPYRTAAALRANGTETPSEKWGRRSIINRRSWSRRSESIFFLKISTEDLNWLRVAWRWNTAGACWLFSKVHGVVKCEERRRKEGNKQTFLDNILSIHKSIEMH